MSPLAPDDETTPPPSTNHQTSPLKWPIILSWLCLVVALTVSLYTARTGSIEDPRSFDEMFYNTLATASWGIMMLAHILVGAVLLIGTHKFGSRALVKGSKLSAWGLAAAWLIVLRVFGVTEPGVWLLMAADALGWLYVAVMMLPSAT